MSKLKTEILSGDIGSIRNQLNKLLENVDEVVSLTQCTAYGGIVLTIIYKEKNLIID